MPYKYSFYIDDDNVFDCVMNSSQCTGISKSTNQRCRNRCIVGYELCHSHLQSVKHLIIKKSTIQNSGNGLFAFDKSKESNAVISKKGEIICN
jgi:hypothetical protein